MSTAAYYIVHINLSMKSSEEDLKKRMNKALDWFRISENTWVLYTTSDATKWYARLAPLVKTDGRVFIWRLDNSDRKGWMDKSFWQWMRQTRSEQT